MSPPAVARARRIAVSALGAALLLVATSTARQNARVSGILKTPDGRPLLSGAIRMSGRDGSEPGVPPEDARILPDGSFSFARVTPGHYQVRAHGYTQANGPTLFATFDIDVAERDVANIEMSLRPGVPLDGRIVVQHQHRGGSLPLTSLMVRAPLVDGSGFGDALTGRVARDGSFVIRGLIIGTHHLLVEGVPPAWTVKSVLLQGRDFTDRPFDVDDVRGLHDVMVTITDASSELAGTVKDAENRPAANAGVLVFAASPAFWIPGGRRVQLTRTDAEGRFILRGLPPGAYLAVASPALDEASARAIRRFERLRDAATALTITADASRATIDLPLLREPPGSER
jgi:hypothetical protein